MVQIDGPNKTGRQTFGNINHIYSQIGLNSDENRISVIMGKEIRYYFVTSYTNSYSLIYISLSSARFHDAT